MQHAVETAMRSRNDKALILDVNATAEEIRVVFSKHNVALEDIAAFVAQLATQYGYPIEFGTAVPGGDRAEV
jgi:hypothetical protein